MAARDWWIVPALQPQRPVRVITANNSITQKRQANRHAQDVPLGVEQHSQHNSFPLFDLPPELRNLVYEKIAEPQTAYLARGEVSDQSGLLATAPILHDEYLPMLLLHAAEVQVEVVNFDFRDVIYSLNRLSIAALNSLSTTSQPRKQQLHIRLEVDNSSNGNVHLLYRWLNWRSRKSNKHSELDISYSLECTYEDDFMLQDPYLQNWRTHFSTAGVLSDWARALDRFLQHGKQGKAKDEAEKIRALFE